VFVIVIDLARMVDFMDDLVRLAVLWLIWLESLSSCMIWLISWLIWQCSLFAWMIRSAWLFPWLIWLEWLFSRLVRVVVFMIELPVGYNRFG